ncbi:hypothetical protein U0070_011701, partial [Myodes glareolus]
VSLKCGFFHDFEDECAVKSLYHTDYIDRAYLQYGFFYAFGEYWDMKRLYHTNYINRISLKYGLFYAFGENSNMHRLYHTDYIYRVFLQYGFFHEFEEDHAMQRLYHTVYIHRVSLQYAFFHDFADKRAVQRLYHTDYIYRVSLQYGFFYAFGDNWDMQRLYHTDYIHRFYSPPNKPLPRQDDKDMGTCRAVLSLHFSHEMLPTAQLDPWLHPTSSFGLTTRRLARFPEWRDLATNRELMRKIRSSQSHSDSDTSQALFCMAYKPYAPGSGVLRHPQVCALPIKVHSEKNPVVVISSAGGHGVPQVVPTPGKLTSGHRARTPSSSGRIQNLGVRS